ncbi:transcriptional repressor [Pseudoprimorskyibacter insulae]|uniref:Zinc uptake regulation protein n=1 Tax=Pseudoprimorskyibacter insulae TaxID=1695997 RepID=A0A2R8AQG5_9RHOB|nr:transcriptional repressor [Pseudoprimorskyibacter insulae]SPF78074.1 Zinc uptake regulation protein [Pseudoprimorskyibacter insulae]
MAHQFHDHNHDKCISGAVAMANAYCALHRLQLTPVRRRVLEILLQQHRAMGAYDVLEILREEKLGSQPPVAYRALEFLVTHGFAHRIERLNAFVACSHPGRAHSPAFLICNTCKTVAETEADLRDSGIDEAARKAQFTIERAVVEVEGLCPRCTETPE